MCHSGVGQAIELQRGHLCLTRESKAKKNLLSPERTEAGGPHLRKGRKLLLAQLPEARQKAEQGVLGQVPSGCSGFVLVAFLCKSNTGVHCLWKAGIDLLRPNYKGQVKQRG